MTRLLIRSLVIAVLSFTALTLVLIQPLSPARVRASAIQTPPSTPVFDTCLLDNSEATLFQFNSITGQYQLTVSSDGFVLAGSGVVSSRGNSRQLTDSRSDRRVTADFNLGTLTGSATIYFMSAQGVWQTFRTIATDPSNSCSCYPFADDYLQASCSNPSGSDDIDWRQKGAVSTVQDQGSLKADWAFSAAGALEGRMQLKTGKLIPLSAQQLVDCAPQPPATAECGGGSPIQAFSFAQKNGVCSSASYPYTARKGACKTCTPVARPSGFTVLCPGEDNLAAAIVQGPVSAVVISDWMPGFTGSGVIDPQCNTIGPHTYSAVLVVGVVNSGVPYWIVKTSLGTSWGARGYFNLIKGKNACGIGNFVSYPNF
jgi:hypothetical protein